jgi:hypothetical protein
MSSRALKSLFAGLALLATTSAFAVPLELELTDIASYGKQGDAANIVYLIDVGANATITGVAYSFSLSAFEPSYLSELNLAFTPTVGFGQSLAPAAGDDFAGTGTYSGFLDLVALGDDFRVGSDGIVRLEFFELFDDFPGADGQWNAGTLTFEVQEAPVPEPATGMLIGAGLLLMGYAGRRRRTRAAAI